MNDSNTGTKLLPLERKAAVSLSLIYCTRMLGLFIIFPVFTLIAIDYEGSTPLLVGVALGMYGLLQAMLQIPFGVLSDRIGRKPVIVGGLILLIAGSIVAALADTIYGLIVGRAMQGAGAISAALIALAADLTRDEQRTKMMAILGSSIGMAFLVSLVLGPVLVGWYSLAGLFWFTGFCAMLSLLLVWKTVPTPAGIKVSGDTVAQISRIGALLRDRQLLRLDAGIFFQHLMVTAMFIGVPLLLVDSGIALESHWLIYAPSVLVSVLIMVPAIILAERHKKMRQVFIVSIIGMGLAQVILGFVQNSWLVVFGGLVLFFSFFNTLEALLPSLVSRLAPPGTKGSAMGVYSTSQFAGAFVGGAGGGWIYGVSGISGLFFALAGICGVWFFLAWGMNPPVGISTHLHSVGDMSQGQGEKWVQACLEIPGVKDVVVVADEGVAYLKVDRSVFNVEQLAAIRC